MLLWLLAVTALACAGGAAAQEEDAVTDQAHREMAEANNAFALDLYQAMRPFSDNQILSPCSLSTILALTWMGTGGRTAEQLGLALHLPETQDRVANGTKAQLDTLQSSEGIVLRIANQLFIHENFTIKDSFRQRATNSFRSDTQTVDFRARNEEARQAINQWVEQNTENKIKNLFPEGQLSVDAVLVLVNAMYFKGEWAKAFKENKTTEQPFHVSSDSHVNVPMMQAVLRTGFARIHDFNASVLELQYKGASSRMLVVLPDEVDGLSQLEDNMSSLNLTSRNFFPMEVQIHLPKFKIESSHSLKNSLEKLGVKDLFSNHCNLTGLTDAQNVLVSKVLQKAFVEVNEKGTEAAVATAVEAVARSGRRRVSFKANHPFLFIIQGADRSILFMGRVTNPSLLSL